ncbi:Stage II sporulation protein D (SpoIID) [Anaerovibrio sp. JC8]|uniref:SpoIID/LytB domain-containing protein n=1 Tax=Anaerovibrio sp. JC8 TaxID=1240085 RepID=UPI000A0B2D34|nr:SpoIID/LytB domain-containing protein [Anaerovibrio sp. JC8]ORU00785.1 Stage II sporulation protein D (SpoIID) [Anaerovibrio sp. JC8]
MMKKDLYKKIAQGMLAAFAGSLVISGGAAMAEASVITPDTGTKPTNAHKRTNPPRPTGASAHNEETQAEQQSAVKKNYGVDNVIRIGIGDGVVKGVISSVNGMNALGGNDSHNYGSFKSNIVASVSAENNNILINGKSTGASSLVFAPVENASGSKIKYNGHEYRGQLVVTAEGGKLLIVNRLSLEDYVKGVLPSEMTPSWNQEALKAQAVAARTFALYTKNQKAHFGSGYDLCDSTHCQSYDGLVNEADSTSLATDATMGLVMTYQGKPIYAPYHSSSGGSTENSEDVWGNYLPYLRSVKDDDSQSPYHNWSVRFTAAQVQKLLSAAGKNIGQLKSISMTAAQGSSSINGVLASGRANAVKFVGTGQTIIINAQDVRKIFGLKSTYFNIRTERAATIPPVKKDVKNNGSANVIDAAPAAMHGTNLRVEGDNVAIVFDGHGFGHGLGMAQYGAKAMADAGKKYDEILHHYYTDVEISKLY